MRNKKTTIPFYTMAGLGAIFVMSALAPLQAQMVCSGSACPYIPLNGNQLNSAFGNLQWQYVDPVMQDMARASTIASMATVPIGTVNLQKTFTGGVSVSGGYVDEHKVTVYVPNVGNFENLPAGGAGANPRVFAGVNLGRLNGETYDPFENGSTPSLFSPLRFDVYVNMFSMSRHNDASFSYNFITGAINPNSQWSASVASRGLEVRYHLMEASPIMGGPLFRFLGVSLGTGYYLMSQNAAYFQSGSKVTIRLQQGTQLIWDSFDYARYQNGITSIPLEVRSGIQLLYFMNLTASAGVSMNRGYSSLTLIKYGHVYGQSDLLNSLLSNISLPDANLLFHIGSNQQVPARLPYGKLGLEFNFLDVKLGVEGIFLQKQKGFNVGLRMEI